MKKTWIKGMAAMLCLSVMLTACGDSEESSSAQQPENEPAAESQSESVSKAPEASAPEKAPASQAVSTAWKDDLSRLDEIAAELNPNFDASMQGFTQWGPVHYNAMPGCEAFSVSGMGGVNTILIHDLTNDQWHYPDLGEHSGEKIRILYQDGNQVLMEADGYHWGGDTDVQDFSRTLAYDLEKKTVIDKGDSGSFVDAQGTWGAVSGYMEKLNIVEAQPKASTMKGSVNFGFELAGEPMYNGYSTPRIAISREHMNDMEKDMAWDDWTIRFYNVQNAPLQSQLDALSAMEGVSNVSTEKFNEKSFQGVVLRFTTLWPSAPRFAFTLEDGIKVSSFDILAGPDPRLQDDYAEAPITEVQDVKSSSNPDSICWKDDLQELDTTAADLVEYFDAETMGFASWGHADYILADQHELFICSGMMNEKMVLCHNFENDRWQQVPLGIHAIEEIGGAYENGENQLQINLNGRRRGADLEIKDFPTSLLFNTEDGSITEDLSYYGNFATSDGTWGNIYMPEKVNIIEEQPNETTIPGAVCFGFELAGDPMYNGADSPKVHISREHVMETDSERDVWNIAFENAQCVPPQSLLDALSAMEGVSEVKAYPVDEYFFKGVVLNFTTQWPYVPNFGFSRVSPEAMAISSFDIAVASSEAAVG